MQKRNIILLIIVLLIIAGGALGFMYLYKPTGNTGGDTAGTNFLSEFFPFGKSNNAKTNEEAPIDISGYVPTDEPEAQKELLTKVSSMPIAGYGVFQKERFVEVVEVEPTPNTNPETETQTTTKTPPPNLPLTKGEEKGGGQKSTEAKPTPPKTEFVPSLRYVEKATGNIYQTFADKIDERKYTATIIPQVYDAYFGKDGNSVAMRYLKQDGKTIETFIGEIPREILGGDNSNENEIKGSFLPDNIKDISISPDKSSLFYLFNTENSAIGITASSLGDKKNQIFSSPFTEWLSQWPNNRMITLTTKPTYSISGFMYYIDPSIKKLNKILSDINGLTTLTSPSGKMILYNNNTLSLRIYNTSTKDSISLAIKTIPEKCVWSTDSTNIYCAVPKYISGEKYPDLWYQGEISFSDEIWKINTENGSSTKIADPTSFTMGEEIDGIKLSLDESENYLFFINKKDSYLWELNLK